MKSKTFFWFACCGRCIEKLNDKSTVADLMEQKIDLLLSDPNHKKNIEV